MPTRHSALKKDIFEIIHIQDLSRTMIQAQAPTKALA